LDEGETNTVVVKVFLDKPSVERSLEDIFSQEVVAALDVSSHPNILPVRTTQWRTRPYTLSMPFCEEGDLTKYVLKTHVRPKETASYSIAGNEGVLSPAYYPITLTICTGGRRSPAFTFPSPYPS